MPEEKLKYLYRTLRWGTNGFEMEGDAKHSEILITECGMRERKVLETSMNNEVAEKLGSG